MGGWTASVPGCGSPPLHGRTTLWAGSSIMALLCDLRKLTDPLWASVSLPAERLRAPTKSVDLRKIGSALREDHVRISLLLRVTSHVRDPPSPTHSSSHSPRGFSLLPVCPAGHILLFPGQTLAWKQNLEPRGNTKAQGCLGRACVLGGGRGSMSVMQTLLGGSL